MGGFGAKSLWQTFAVRKPYFGFWGKSSFDEVIDLDQSAVAGGRWQDGGRLAAEAEADAGCRKEETGSKMGAENEEAVGLLATTQTAKP